MPEISASTTELTSQYVAQVSSDLERNVKEQERVSSEIASLRDQLASLQHDHTLLVSMQQALGVMKAPDQHAEESADTAVPSPRRKAGSASEGRQGTRKAVPASTNKAVRKKPATKAKAPAKAAEPTLVELIRRHLAELKDPRSAAEVSAALGQANPERKITTNVVRVTLEGLVAKSQAMRTKQGRSVFYAGFAVTSADSAAADAPAAEADR